MSVMTLPANLDQLTADELRELVCRQAEVITRNDQELNWRKAKIDKLTHEVAYYKRHYFGVTMRTNLDPGLEPNGASARS